MTFIPTTNAVRVDIQFDVSGQQVHNVIWCSRSAAWTQAQREELGDAIISWWETTGYHNFSVAMGLTGVTVVNQESDSAPSSVRIPSSVTHGELVSGSAANNAAACVTLRTDLRGRSYRGRMYLGGIDTSKISNGITFVTGWITSILSALVSLKSVIEGLGAIWVIVSKQHNKVLRDQGVKTPITAISMDAYVDSQRRRLGLRGV